MATTTSVRTDFEQFIKTLEPISPLQYDQTSPIINTVSSNHHLDDTIENTDNNDHDNSINDKNIHKIRLGIACMDKKLKSERHKNVISRIQAYGDIEIVTFGDSMMLDQVLFFIMI